jgi:hypothetical protein
VRAGALGLREDAGELPVEPGRRLGDRRQVDLHLAQLLQPAEGADVGAGARAGDPEPGVEPAEALVGGALAVRFEAGALGPDGLHTGRHDQSFQSLKKAQSRS